MKSNTKSKSVATFDVREKKTEPSKRRMMERLREIRKSVKGKINIRKMIEEGRKY